MIDGPLVIDVHSGEVRRLDAYAFYGEGLPDHLVLLKDATKAQLAQALGRVYEHIGDLADRIETLENPPVEQNTSEDRLDQLETEVQDLDSRLRDLE